jgi:hypothetical protein
VEQAVEGEMPWQSEHAFAAQAPGTLQFLKCGAHGGNPVRFIEIACRQQPGIEVFESQPAGMTRETTARNVTCAAVHGQDTGDMHRGTFC